MSASDDEITAIATIIGTKGNRGTDLVKKAEAFKSLSNLHRSTKELSSITRIDHTSVKRYLKIATLPDEVKKMISEGAIESYHVAAELTRINDERRLKETANSILHISREKAREVIRYVLKHPELEARVCASTVLEAYEDVIDAMVFIYEVGELFKMDDFLKLKKMDNHLLNDTFNKIIVVEGNVSIKFEGSTVIFVTSRKTLDLIKKKCNDSSFKSILKSVINQILNQE